MSKIMRSLIIIILLSGGSVVADRASGQEMDPALFSPSGMISVEASKREMKKLYAEGGPNKTLHCECYFNNKLAEVTAGICDYGTPTADEKQTLDWVHAMPSGVFAASLKCWAGCSLPAGQTDKGKSCCAGVSPKYKTLEADMHNLFPYIQSDAEEGKSRLFGGMSEYRFCGDPAISEPQEKARGEIARAYFYMSYQYKIPIPEELENRLRMWHLLDPPDAWEEQRNTAIEIVQGNRNPFIDHPALVERVRDF